MGTENSSAETRSRAGNLAKEIGRFMVYALSDASLGVVYLEAYIAI